MFPPCKASCKAIKYSTSLKVKSSGYVLNGLNLGFKNYSTG